MHQSHVSLQNPVEFERAAALFTLVAPHVTVCEDGVLLEVAAGRELLAAAVARVAARLVRAHVLAQAGAVQVASGTVRALLQPPRVLGEPVAAQLPAGAERSVAEHTVEVAPLPETAGRRPPPARGWRRVRLLRWRFRGHLGNGEPGRLSCTAPTETELSRAKMDTEVNAGQN